MTEVKLDYPVEREGHPPLTRVLVRRLRVREIAAMEAARPQGEVAVIVALVASLNDLPTSLVEEIDAADIRKISEALVPFLEAVEASGEPSSPKLPTH